MKYYIFFAIYGESHHLIVLSTRNILLMLLICVHVLATLPIIVGIHFVIVASLSI